jgi:hypothetical protein
MDASETPKTSVESAPWYRRLYFRVVPWKEHLGVRVTVATTKEAVEAAALRKVFAALDVLKAHSPGHLARISRYMIGIVVFPRETALGTWDGKLGICILDEKYVTDDATPAEEVACTIVHELTHARLERAGFQYRPNRARCERICFLAERNFARRLPESPIRQALEERIDNYLAMPADHWSDLAVAERSARERRSWPWWQRTLYWTVQLVWKVRRRGGWKARLSERT